MEKLLPPSPFFQILSHMSAGEGCEGLSMARTVWSSRQNLRSKNSGPHPSSNVLSL